MPHHQAPVGHTAALLALLARHQDRGVSSLHMTAELGLPAGTVRDLLDDLRAEGLVAYDGEADSYRLTEAFPPAGGVRQDCNDIRAAAMPWADNLAAHSGMSVRLAVAHPEGAQVIHHVFRPDNSPQRLTTGAVLPPTSAAARVLEDPHDGRCVLDTDTEEPELASLAVTVPCRGVTEEAALFMTGPRGALDPARPEAARQETLLRDAAATISAALVPTSVR
ncbi:IclR family transcriptional regulator [Streptomyces sp. NPDC001407]|uniref:IclR family transcriptional regulator n=1 Tax=unclassified Streptomyces TaxID=2593676 RepID=UPI0033CE8BCB